MPHSFIILSYRNVKVNQKPFPIFSFPMKISFSFLNNTAASSYLHQIFSLRQMSIHAGILRVHSKHICATEIFMSKQLLSTFRLCAHTPTHARLQHPVASLITWLNELAGASPCLDGMHTYLPSNSNFTFCVQQ